MQLISSSDASPSSPNHSPQQQPHAAGVNGQPGATDMEVISNLLLDNDQLIKDITEFLQIYYDSKN